MENYTLSEWEPIDEHYDYEDEEEVGFAEGVFGEQNIMRVVLHLIPIVRVIPHRWSVTPTGTKPRSKK